MKESKKTAIIIPIYKTTLSDIEKISLAQALKVLKNYDMYFVCAKGLEYEYQNERIRERRFEDEWFSSVQKYSALMLRKEFYVSFAEYEYILIYQLDAFVFEDRLSDFCSLGYDYIGAPWIHGIVHYKDTEHILHYVGNGGLSLRNVSAFIFWLDHVDLTEYIESVNEDILIAAYGTLFLNIAGMKEALDFSFDLDPRGCYQKNGERLPFGCHAWHKMDFFFWKPFIEKQGYDLTNIPDSGLIERYRLRYELEEERNDYIKRLQKYVVTVIQGTLQNRKCRVYIWGTGVFGKLSSQIFRDAGIIVEAFVDNRCEELQPKYMDISIVSGTHFLEKAQKGDAVVLVAVIRSESIVKQLEEAGLTHGVDYITLEDLK